jgi:hypothetical protein
MHIAAIQKGGRPRADAMTDFEMARSISVSTDACRKPEHYEGPSDQKRIGLVQDEMMAAPYRSDYELDN